MNIHLKNLISDLSDSLISALSNSLSYYDIFKGLKDDLEGGDESLKNDTIFKKLEEKTANLWISLWNLIEDEDGYPYKSISVENLTEIKKEIFDYLVFLELLYDANWLFQLLESTNSMYLHDIQLQLQKIINNEIQFCSEINKSLAYWKDTVPQALILDGLLFLKFIFMYKKAEEQLGLLFPDKLKKEIERMYELQWEKMPNILFEECTKKLKAKILSSSESSKITNEFLNKVPITSWGKIDWQKIDKKVFLQNNVDKIVPALEQLFNEPLDTSVFIDWSESGNTIIETDLKLVSEFFDDVAAVSFDKFIFNLNQAYIIEVRHMNEITIGKL
jgi:hypothetical protein